MVQPRKQKGKTFQCTFVACLLAASLGFAEGKGSFGYCNRSKQPCALRPLSRQ